MTTSPAQSTPVLTQFDLIPVSPINLTQWQVWAFHGCRGFYRVGLGGADFFFD